MYQRTGFTLLDMMVVVIIIGVLVLIAVPQYKHAVLKSRYSALLPVAQHLKTAQEAYYTGNSYYSDDLSTLDLDVPGTITSATTATYGDNMSAKISTQEDEEEEYSYVLASKEGLNNNYIMYQEHSKNYPGEIHCEAKNGDSYAQWLCEKGLSGQKIEKGSITPGYTTYIISGSGNGTFSKACEEEKELEDASCACGKKTRTTTGCDEKTGEWKYGEWSSCPVKPEEEKNCDNGVNAKMTRTSQCQGGTWTEPAWNKSACCDPADKPVTTRSCKDNYSTDTCGLEVQKYTCNASGNWEALDEWDSSACTTAPSGSSENCESPFTYGTRTSSYSCVNNEWQENWDATSCGYSCEGDAPTQQFTCPLGCGKYTGTASCNYETGLWGTEYTGDDSSCPAKPEDITHTCGARQDITATIPLTATCKADGSAWEYVPADSLCSAWVASCESEGDADKCAYTNYSPTAASSCRTDVAGGCSKSRFNGGAYCQTTVTDGCQNSTFSSGSYCVSYYASYACRGSVFQSGGICRAQVTGGCRGITLESGASCESYADRGCRDVQVPSGSSCVGRAAKGCRSANILSGGVCEGRSKNGCEGATIRSGGVCYAYVEGGCEGADMRSGSCCRESSSGYCGSLKKC